MAAQKKRWTNYWKQADKNLRLTEWNISSVSRFLCLCKEPQHWQNECGQRQAS